MDADQLLELIKTRRSVRRFAAEAPEAGQVAMILEAGRWAPSGQNNQPWRFVVVADAQTRGRLAQLTHYGKIIENAPLCIGVFSHKPSQYHQIKDAQAVGACLQNMLLMAHALGLGAVWLGEILKNAEQARQVLGLSDDLELMAVVALGRPAGPAKATERLELSELVAESYPAQP
ncbi:nitroreductase [Desulfarculus baarsii DSM 2075]|uniref:Nitroreductase n=1 Tax=Desulfarculus baarsii (strain ATCC 33931 / DSM 2075 / LMG 7858 / VKM B-1802 / 2st14) TaxID=644282 RepID=E1QFX5_DESB2|nr:nitroreductase family protein [Desulfarculus baarsii]ADK84585.1 nitroreductase [Desulfarculus baarsii DSM 2075]